MLIKECHYSPVNTKGEQVVHFLRPGHHGRELIKTAAPLLPKVAEFVQNITPSDDKIYVLVNAMGAGEYWGSNINADYFSEASLCHKGKDYGYLTFYNAHPFRHHQNKDPKKAFGDVLLSCWNPHMKRVELVIALDRKRALVNGAQGVIDKIDSGQFPSVSMGAKVAYDLCSICYDKEKYKKAEATFDPVKHTTIAKAVLEYHKKDPIRGLSRTRKDYCQHMKTQKNKILPNGSKVFVYNPYPKFFDISFVFIGADKTAFMLGKLAESNPPKISYHDMWNTKIASEPTHYSSTGMAKVASVSDDGLDQEFIKAALWGGHKYKIGSIGKEGEIVKKITSNFVRKTLPKLEESEELIDDKKLDDISSKYSLEDVLSTLSHMGIILRPKEFQRVVLVNLGQRDVADDLDRNRVVFRRSSSCIPGINLKVGRIINTIADALEGYMTERSVFPPFLTRRSLRIVGQPRPTCLRGLGGYGEPRSRGVAVLRIKVADGLLDNISGLYNTYRQQQFEKLAQLGNEAASNYPLSKKVAQEMAAQPGALPALYAARYYRPESQELEEQASFIERNPWFSTIVMLGALGYLGRKLAKK